MQAARHEPQFELSVMGSTQRSPHTICPAGHSARHTPSRQNVPSRQRFPQPPQLLGSRSVLTQTTPDVPASPSEVSHAVRPAEHATSHTPSVQTVPGPQRMLHMPQFCWSVLVLTHAPPQRDCPFGQSGRQRPWTQEVVAVSQREPQAPQLLLSSAALAHAPLHESCGKTHPPLPPPISDEQPKTAPSAIKPARNVTVRKVTREIGRAHV